MKQSGTKNQQTKGMPKLLWVWKMKDAQGLSIGSSRKKRGEKRERSVGCYMEAWGCWFNCLETLEKVPLNRHKVWIPFKIKQPFNTSPICTRNPYSFSYLTPFRRSFRRQLLEPLHPQINLPYGTHGTPHAGPTRPLMGGHAQLDQIKWHPIKTIKDIN